MANDVPQSAAAASTAHDDFLVAANISKRFGITQALSDVSVSFRKGEIHALMGENGAGKSTLGKIISGLYRQDSGTITLDGVDLPPGSIDASFAAGVRIVHQELAQCPNLSVAENLSLHDMPRNALGVVDFRTMRERAAKLVHTLDPDIDVTAPLGLLSPGRRQICQIAAALDDRAGHGANHGTGPRVIVFDEPTSSLSVAEADRLIDITRGLAKRGLTIIYVSHRMGEIFQVCDRVTVLRDGQFVATTPIADLDEPTLVEQMIGRRITTPNRGEHSRAVAQTPAHAAPHTEHDDDQHAAALGASHAHVAPGRVMLEVNGLSSPKLLDDISLQVRAGEIVGIGGLVGAGRSELLNAIFGLDPKASGAIRVEGRDMPITAKHAIDAGLGYVPEDRRNQGLFFLLGIDENIVMPFMSRMAAALGIRAMHDESRAVTQRCTDFRVKAASHASLPGELSGGNQQKLLIARWMTPSTKVLLLDEPTRGIDVGTKAEVYRIVREAADKGLAVLLVSSEMPELLALSDRVLVMCSGKITGELKGEDMTQSNILRLATVDSTAPCHQRAGSAAR